MKSIAENYTTVSDAINRACYSAKRDSQSVQLLAVSKTREAAQLEALYHAGQVHFGENYLQEALDKQQLLSHLPLVWHFIGPIQSNKTRAISENFSWVHSVDRLKIARRLAEQRPTELPPLNVCIQVNISNEESKAGCLASETLALVQQASQLKQLKVRGLMAIPKATTDLDEQQQAFRALSTLLVECQAHCPGLDTLSMGMSADLEPAISQGATMVRVGTALFGPRDYAK